MNRNILCILLGFVGCAGVFLAVAQTASSTPMTTASPKKEKIEVKNYKSFLEYSAKSEQLAIKAGKAASLKPDEVIKFKEEGIELSERNPIGQGKDYRKEVYLGNNRQIAVYDQTNHKVRIVDSNGRLIREGKISKFHRESGVLSFSDKRVFVIGGMIESNGGFKIFSYDGNLIKEVNPGFIAGYAVSHNQKYFAVTAGNPETGDFFILYNINGDELWRQKTVMGGNVKIDFSRDDKFAAIRMQDYWVKTGSETTGKERKLYLIDVENHKVISEETYGK